MKRWIKFIRPYKVYFFLGPLLMLTEVGGEIVLPKLMGEMIDKGILGGMGEGFLIRQALLMLGFILLMICGGIGGHYFSIKAAVNFSADLRKAAFDRVQEFSFRNIDSISTGSIITRLTNDITQIMNITRMGLIMAVRSPGMLVGGIIMAFSINARLASVLLVLLPLLSSAVFLLMRTAMPRFGVMQKKLDHLNEKTQENITNIRVIKSFVREEFEKKRFSKSNQDLCDATFRALKIIVCTMPVMTLVMNSATIITLWRGGNLVVNGSIQVGSLSAMIQYITQILSSLMMVSMMIISSSRAITSFKRVNEILLTEPDLKDEGDRVTDRKVEKGDIAFRNVSFKYYPSSPDYILKNVSFEVRAGTVLGIIGSTGSGKSSLVSLIPRLYDADEGEVLVDGVNVKEYPLKNLRDGVSMVLQKNVLFSGSIEENLKWGAQDADMQEIKTAAKNAQADGFVSAMADGYQTKLERGGANVSGGQKQRLCIARALLKNPKILILDDSTSAVDTATEAKIKEMLKTNLPDTTKIIIAQRIGSVIDADKILVLDDGKIVGEGTHEVLLNTCAEYKEIYDSQIEKEVS